MARGWEVSFWGNENILKVTVERWLHKSMNVLKSH